MKRQVKCESDFFFVHLTRQLSESGEPWTAMDAYLRIVETCNRCPIRDCQGMVARDHSDYQVEGDLSPFADLGALEPDSSSGIGEIHASDDAATLGSVFALADVLPRSCVVTEPMQEGGVETEVGPGDRSALARFLGMECQQ